MPDVQIKLGNDDLEPPQCNFGISTYGETLTFQWKAPQAEYTVYSYDSLTNSTRDDSTGDFTRMHLYQNYQGCIPSSSALANVTSIGFSSNSANVSFCLQDFQMLPSQVASPGEQLCTCTTACHYGVMHTVTMCLMHTCFCMSPLSSRRLQRCLCMLSEGM